MTEKPPGPSGKCVFCEKKVPQECTGEIQDHCDWCGGPASTVAEDGSIYGSRWCSEKCKAEDDWPKKAGHD